MEMVGQELMFTFLVVYNKTIVVVLLIAKQQYDTTTISIRYTLSEVYVSISWIY